MLVIPYLFLSTGVRLSAALSTAFGYRTGTKTLCSRPSARLIICRSNSSSPSYCVAETPTAGNPVSAESAARSIFMPRWRASSIMFTQSIVFGIICATCMAKIKLRSKQQASHTTTAASGCSKQRKSRVASSSAEFAVNEYAPGKSTSRTSFLPQRKCPSAVPTVFPLQLPVCWCRPVRALNTVLLPTLGLPARAITGVIQPPPRTP